MGRPPLTPGTHGDIWFEQWWRPGASPGGEKRRVRQDDPKPGLDKTTWTARVRVCTSTGTIKEIQRSGPTKRKAPQKLEAAIASTTPASASGIQPHWTIRQLAEYWLEHRANTGLYRRSGPLKPSTLAQYSATVRTTLLGERKSDSPKGSAPGGLGALRLRDCTRASLQAWITELERDRSSVQVRSVLKQMLDLAMVDQAIPDNPVRLLAPPKRESVDVRALSVSEAQLLLRRIHPNAARIPGRRKPKPDLFEITAFMLGTGCRIGEVLAVRWRDLDLEAEAATAHICGTLIEPREGEIPNLMRQDTTKSDESRVLLLPDSLVGLLKDRHTRIKGQRGTPDPEETVFSTRTGTLRWPANVRTALRVASQRVLGCEEGVHPHTLRRTVATLIAHEMSHDAAAEQMGHSAPEDRGQTVTSRFYIAKRMSSEFPGSSLGPDARHALEALLLPGVEFAAQEGDQQR